MVFKAIFNIAAVHSFANQSTLFQMFNLNFLLAAFTTSVFVF